MNRPDVERLLKERLGKAQDLRKAYELLDEIGKDPQKYFSGDEKKAEALKKMLAPDGAGGKQSFPPEVMEFITKWAKDQQLTAEAGKVSPKDVDRLMKDLLQQEPVRKSLGLPPNGERPSETEPALPTDSLPERLPVDAAPLPAPPPNSKLSPGMMEFAERVLKAVGQDPDALRRAGDDVNRRRLQQAEDWLPFAKMRETLRGQLPQLNRSLRLDRFFKQGESFVRSQADSLKLGDRRNLLPDRRPGSLPGGPRPIGNVGSSGWQLLVGALFGVVLGAFLWKLLRPSYGTIDMGVNASWKLGPWPVDPATVRTREELVRAFEHLTLLCLGPAARCWNHLEIATRLGGESSADRRRAADQLAGLYEQARYAPPDEPLPDTELDTARRHICFLAGVSAA